MHKLILQKKRSALVSIGILCLVAIGVVSLSMYYSSKTYLVDAAIEIGYGGIHREFNPSEDLFEGNQSRLRSPLESVDELLQILDIAYGFDRNTDPTLRRRDSKHQHHIYVGIVTLTAEGSDILSTINYLSQITQAIVSRHNQIFHKRREYLQNYHLSVMTLRSKIIKSCLSHKDGEQLNDLSSTDSNRCGENAIKSIIRKGFLINNLLAEINITPSRIILEPTLRPVD